MVETPSKEGTRGYSKVIRTADNDLRNQIRFYWQNLSWCENCQRQQAIQQTVESKQVYFVTRFRKDNHYSIL